MVSLRRRNVTLLIVSLTFEYGSKGDDLLGLLFGSSTIASIFRSVHPEGSS